jgi:hypothetical protein
MKKNKVFGVLLSGGLLLGSFGKVHSMEDAAIVLGCFVGCGCGIQFGMELERWCNRRPQPVEAESPVIIEQNIAPPHLGAMVPPPPGYTPQPDEVSPIDEVLWQGVQTQIGESSVETQELLTEHL